MRTLALSACCALFAATVPAVAQSGNPMTDAMKAQFAIVKGDLTKTAEQVTEENYAFKPTPDVRNLGALIGHVADASYYFCSTASGAANPMKGTSVEKSKTSKADLQKALNDALAFCDAQLNAMTDAKGAEMVDFFGGKQPRMAVFAFNTAHDFEHYGNLVTYMRLKGMVPPSSQKGMKATNDERRRHSSLVAEEPLLTVRISRLPGTDDLSLPAYQSAHAAAMDLHAAVTAPITLAPGGIVLVGCGFAMALPEGFEGQVRPRSGLASKSGVTVVNAPGTIDADYRGEVKVALINLGPAPFVVERGARIAQLVVAPVTRVSWEQVDALDGTARGAGGFGHTGT